MAYFNTLLLLLGFGGSLLLLGLNSIPRFRYLRKPLSATWLTIFTLAFALSPDTGRWVLSVWAPSNVTNGLFVMDVTPEIWWCVLLIGTAFSSLVWVSVGERKPSLQIAGSILVLYVLVMWLSLTSGSLLMVLAAWSLFDVIWFLSRLSDTGDGERAVWAVAVSGVSSILLWVVSLFLLDGGSSGIWWLMRPDRPLFILLVVAALMRVGYYPFQVVHSEDWGRSRSLTLASVISPLLGIGLLYRLMMLPGERTFPAWALVWGGLSVFWSGIKALSHDGREALLPAAYGLLIAQVAGAMAVGEAGSLLISSGIWVAALALLAAARRYQPRAFGWTWPTTVAVLAMVGVPPSPFWRLFQGAFAALPWVPRVLYVIGLATSIAALVRGSTQRASARVTPAYAHRWLPIAAGLLLSVGAIVLVSALHNIPLLDPLPFALWSMSCVGGFLLAMWGHQVVVLWGRAHALLDLLDLRWLYRSVWQGANNIFGVLRVTAEVVEGSGSVLWSVLILLLVLMVVNSR